MLRLLLTPRWLLRSALAVVVAGAFVWLGLWQWERAQSSTGRGTNVAYAIEWFVFAAFVFFCLWHWLKDSREAEDGTEAPPPPAPPPLPHLAHGARPVATSTPSVDPDDDPELAAYNAHLARLDAEARRGQRR